MVLVKFRFQNFQKVSVQIPVFLIVVSSPEMNLYIRYTTDKKYTLYFQYILY